MRVHRNLHNAKRGGPQWVETKAGKVARYLDEVKLHDVSTRIQPAGQAKCQTSGVRSVVSFFDGVEGASIEFAIGTWERVEYDPRVDNTFLVRRGDNTAPWNVAIGAHLRADGSTWVLGARWESKA
jgi:hypothetical protein